MLDYGDNKSVQINTSALNQYSNSVKIVGSKGEITVKREINVTHIPLNTIQLDSTNTNCVHL